MELILQREYFPDGTNGTLQLQGKEICKTIELPWKENARRVSCIPEGEYYLKRRYSQKFGWHLHLQEVPDRDLILIHPANNAKIELLGCIAPVSAHSGIGTGSSSRKAITGITRLVYPALAEDEEVKIIIKSKIIAL